MRNEKWSLSESAVNTTQTFAKQNIVKNINNSFSKDFMFRHSKHIFVLKFIFCSKLFLVKLIFLKRVV